MLRSHLFLGSLRAPFFKLSDKNLVICSLFYSVDDRVTSECWWIGEEKHHVLSGIRTDGLIIQATKTYSSDRAATGTGKNLVLFIIKQGAG
jgi:hypothetical protein